MDKKAVQILNRLMDDRKKHSVSAEELAYARTMGVVVEDQPITHDQALDVLERCFETVSLENAAQAFLYSLSSRDVDYRYILASYVYARSWFSLDRGRTQEVPEKLTGTFFNWVKHKGGGIWGTIGKPIFYLEQFVSMERRAASDGDVEILRLILELADSMGTRPVELPWRPLSAPRSCFPATRPRPLESSRLWGSAGFSRRPGTLVFCIHSLPHWNATPVT